MVTGTKQIPNLPQGSSIIGWEPFETVQNGFSVKVTAAQIAAYAGGGSTVGRGALNAISFGAVGNGTADDTAALQAWINAGCLAVPGAPGLYLPAGTYKITSPLTLPQRYISMFGDGSDQSLITFNGVSGGCLVASSMSVMNATFHDFGLIGNSSSGRGMDFGAVSSAVYLGEFRNLHLVGGGECIYIPNDTFSITFQNIYGLSYNQSTFLVSCGPGVTMINCYAAGTGPLKAGFRMAGIINLIGCNGMAGGLGDYWGVFGSNTAASDGFQHDFAFTDYASVVCINCNAEAYSSISTTASAIYMQNSFRQLEWIGGKFEGPATSFHSVIRLTGASILGVPVILSPAWWVFDGGAATAANLFTDSANVFVDQNGVLAGEGTTTYAWAAGGSSPYPTIVRQPANDTATTYEVIARAHIASLSLSNTLITTHPIEILGVGAYLAITGVSAGTGAPINIAIPTGNAFADVVVGTAHWQYGPNAGGGGDDCFNVYSYTAASIGLSVDSTAKVIAKKDFAHQGTNLGFFNTTPTTKPTVSGSRGGNAALASLLTALAGLGLIIDGSS